MECIGCSKMSRYMGILRAKHSKNRRKTKSRVKTKKTRRGQGTHGRAWLGARPCISPQTMVATTVSLWWLLVLPVDLVSRTTRFRLPLDLDLGLESSCFGPPL